MTPDPAVHWRAAYVAADRLQEDIERRDLGAAMEALAEVEGHLADTEEVD